MLQASELRIGNKIYFSYRYKKENLQRVVEVVALRQGIVTVNDSGTPLVLLEKESLKPIPLTPEILEKCGLTREADGNEYRIGLPIGHGTDLVLEVLNMDSSPYDALISDTTADQKPNLYSYLKPQRYVHSLQNLYFALTGTELTVNL